MKKGYLILLPFPFTDLKGKKLRPALILFSNEVDVTVSFITSELKWKENYDLEIKANKTNNLKVDSLIRLTKIATIDKELVIGKLGELSLKQMNEINERLKLIFKI